MYESHHDPIPEKTKKKILALAAKRTAATNEGDIGLIYLDREEMFEIFGPYIKKLFDKDMRFERSWVHWMKDGGSRPRHQHSAWTYLYYLDIPDGECGNIVFDDDELKPIEGTHIMFPAKTYHSINPNNTHHTRWAFSAECIPV